MTNPNNAIGTNAAYGGRTSVNAFNDDLAAYNRGIMSGWQCVPNTGLTVSVGGVSGTRDVAIAEDNIGNKTTVNNISFAPVNVSLAAAPVANSRIDLIVVYVDGSPDGTAEDVDNPSACGIISVKGTAAASPVEPSDSDIRDAITADGASGSTAYYTVLASVTIASGVTEITSAMIVGGLRSELALIGAVVSEPTSLAYVDTVNIVDKAVTADKIDFSTLVPGALVTDYGQITSTTTITPSVNGYLVGKAVIFKTQANASGSCYVTGSSGAFLAGIPFADVAKGQYDANLQIAWSIQVAAGETYTLTVSGDGKFDSVGLHSMSTS